MSNFFQKLQQRQVFKATITYAVVAWAIIQVCDILFPAFDISHATIRYVLYILIGFSPVWIIFAYVFEWTPTGFRKAEEVTDEKATSRLTGKRLNAVIIVGLTVAVLLLVIDRVFHITGNSESSVTDSAKSIAVLPFVNMSNDADQEYFSDGLSEELLNLLSKIPDLKVIARTSSFAFKGKNEDLRIIGEKLGVANILEGSVRKNGDKLRITAQLIKASDGTHLWSETYDRTLDDIFKVQDEISASVVAQLKLKLLSTEIAQSRTHNVQSYNLWLEGNYFNEKRTKENYEKAMQKYTAALAIDSAFASAWVGLAAVYSRMAGDGYVPVKEAYTLAQESVDKALYLDPQLASAYAIQERIYMDYDWDWANAEAAYKEALKLDPNNAEALINASILAGNLGDYNDAISFNLQAIALSPLTPRYYSILSTLYHHAGRLQEAEAAIRKALELNPAYGHGWTLLVRILLEQNKPGEALEAIMKETSDTWKTSYLPEVYFKLNRKSDSDAALKELIDRYSSGSAYQIAEAYAYRGEIDSAFQWMERAYEQRDGGLSQMKDDPFMKNLVNDPRWIEFLRKMKLQ